MNMYCCRGWLNTFDFSSYSEKYDGLYCLACMLFPDTSHRRPRKLILEPYRNWKDAIADLKVHGACDYHNTSMARLNAFKKTYINGSCRIDGTITDANTKQVEQNRIILKSLV